MFVYKALIILQLNQNEGNFIQNKVVFHYNRIPGNIIQTISAGQQERFQVHKYINNIIVKSSMKSQQFLKFQQAKLKRQLIAGLTEPHRRNHNVSSTHMARGSWNENRKVQIQTKSKRRNSIRAQNYFNLNEKPISVQIRNWRRKSSFRLQSTNSLQLNDNFTNRISQNVDQVRRFSDLKKNLKRQEQKYVEASQSSYKLKCQNHAKRLAKFYIKSTEQRNIQYIHYYCLECSINLSKKNFKIKPLYQKFNIPNKDCFHSVSFQSSLISLISYKNELNDQCELTKNNQSLINVEHIIKETEEKYVHYRDLLAQIEKQEMNSLLKLKSEACIQIKRQIRQIQSVQIKIQQLLQFFSNQWKNSDGSWNSSNALQMKQLQRQLQKFRSSQFNVKIKIPKSLSTSDISHKLESLFNKTVHELSFQQLDSEPETPQLKQACTFHPISSLKPEPTVNPKLQRYLFNQSSQNQAESSDDYFNFNSTLKNCISKEESHQLVQGIDFALSMTGSFCDQQNIMMNI